MEILNSIFFFIVAIGILVAFHEYGHFWTARQLGVKVLRFSIGFGKVCWSYRKHPDSTEYALSAVPLGGYVKMVDEREGEVKPEDQPYAFNRQPVWSRALIVAAGPVFNLVLAVFMFWCAAILGEIGVKPIVGEVKPGTLAASAGFEEGDEILAVNDKKTPIWSEVLNSLYSEALKGSTEIRLLTKTIEGSEETKTLVFSQEDIEHPERLNTQAGLTPWSPQLAPVIGKVLPDGAAAEAGLEAGDLILKADEQTIQDWLAWVDYVQTRPEQPIKLLIERHGVQSTITITPRLFEQNDREVGKIGAGVDVPADVLDELKVNYRLSPLEALPAAFGKTWFIATSSLKMMGKMLVGQASVSNLSGPISIAQYAGQTAEMGLVYFLKYLGLISVSLGVLNLLPIPVLDGGHLVFFAIEAVKGSPIPEKIQLYVQQIGVFLLMALMSLVVFLDIERLFQ